MVDGGKKDRDGDGAETIAPGSRRLAWIGVPPGF